MNTVFQKLARYFQDFWHLGVLDLKRGLWTVEPSPEKIPYLKAQNAIIDDSSRLGLSHASLS